MLLRRRFARFGLFSPENFLRHAVRVKWGSAMHNAAARHLADELTATETDYPGTDLRLIFTLPEPV